MRTVQFRILSRILDLVPVPAYIHGFEKNKSIPVMAQAHVGKDVVISIDIKDFFPSIKQFMVEHLFTTLGMDQKSARLLSELTTYKSYVPQGSLTAPKISNLIAAGTFGKEVFEYCNLQNLSLTIYADDITVSYNVVANSTLEQTRARVTEIISNIETRVEKYGFRINKEKTKVMRRNTRQWVCGAVVNDKVNMKRVERYQLRAIVHNCKVNGVEAEAAKSKTNVENFIRKYAGRINWMCQLNPDAGLKFKLEFRKIVLPYLAKNKDIEIPELSWNSGIEMPYVASPEDDQVFLKEALFPSEKTKASSKEATNSAVVDSPF